MTKHTIQLNSDKVRLRIAEAGGPVKKYAVGVNERTITRIKQGKRTTLTTAHRLATNLGTTCDDLQLPPGREEVERQLPRNWLYESITPSNAFRKHLPAQLAIGGDPEGYIVDHPPSGWHGPLDALLKWYPQSGRKIILRRSDDACVIELHYFEYTSDRAQELDYFAASACRFFPLARSSDTFKKTALSELNADWVWGDLWSLAMERGDIVDIEGHDTPAHPRNYMPVARFYRGLIVRRKLEGVRVFRQFHRDFRRALIEYLEELDPGRVQVSTRGLGIEIRVVPLRPEVYDPYWQDNELCIEVDLAWWRPDGRLAPAPWREDHRERIVASIKERNWNAIYSPGLPIAYPTESEDDDEDPPLAPDMHIPARVAKAVMDLYCPEPEEWQVSVSATV